MTPQEAAYSRAVATGAEAIAEAVEADPARKVPNCPSWDLAALARHVGLLYVRVSEQVRRRSPEPVRSSELPPAPQERALGPWLRQSADRLLEALRSTDGDVPAGHWRDQAVTAGFWWRRMAHETIVHRVDAEDCLGRAALLDSDLAVDGTDEVLELFLPFSTGKGTWPPDGALWLVRADGPEQWWVEAGKGNVHVRRQPPGSLPPEGPPLSAAARVEAPANELFLMCWGRRVPPTTEVTGSYALLEDWLSVLGW